MIVRLVMEADVPSYLVEGLKEDMAMYCEKYGDVKIIQVDDGSRPVEQMKIGGL